MLPVVIIAWCGSCLHTVTKQGCKLHTVTQFRCLHCSGAQPAPFWGDPSCQPLLLLTSEVMESCKLAARWRWWVAGKPCPYAPRLLCCERSEAWKAERSGCKRERAGSTSMEASSLSAAGAPSTPLWTVGYRLAGLQALDGGAQPHPPAWAMPAPHSSPAPQLPHS